jgi:Tol biopolymer transport system component
MGAALGTAAYMSPEQARGEKLDARSDLFSFGLVLYEMATGRQAFSGETAVLHNAILTRTPPSARELNPDLPPEMERIIGKALEKDQQVRYQHASDVRADLMRLRRATEPSRTSSAAPTPAPTGRGKRRWLLPAGVAFMAAAAAAVWFSRPMPPPRVTGTVQITNDGKLKDLAVTDGTRLYYYSAEGRPVLIPAKGGEPIAMADSLFGLYPLAIAPDGSELLLKDVSSCALWMAPAMGGSRRWLGDLVATGGADWSPDRRQIVYVKGHELHIARSDGSELRKLATLEGDANNPMWSPDGQRIRFTVAVATNASALWEIATDGSDLHALFPNWKNSQSNGGWTSDGQYFIFQAENKGTWSLWARREKTSFFDRGGRNPVQLTTGPMQTTYPIPSRDGRRIFFLGSLERTELVRYDATKRQWDPYLSGVAADRLDFSRDGKWVTYTTYGEGSVWRSAVDGSQRRQLTSPPLAAGSPRWSPDGQRIAFAAGDPARVFIEPAEGGAPVQLTNGESGAAGDIDPTWSPDGSSLVFSSFPPRDPHLPSDKILLRIVNLNTRRISVLPGSKGLWSARWSPDGHFIAATRGDEDHHRSKLVLFDPKEVRQTKLVDRPGMEIDYPSWSKDGQFIYFYIWRDAWYRMRIRDRKLERLFSTKNLQYAENGWMGLDPDGAALFLRRVSSSEIYALDWEAP